MLIYKDGQQKEVIKLAVDARKYLQINMEYEAVQEAVIKRPSAQSYKKYIAENQSQEVVIRRKECDKEQVRGKGNNARAKKEANASLNKVNQAIIEQSQKSSYKIRSEKQEKKISKRPRTHTITEKGSEDEEYGPYNDSKEEDSDDNYYTYVKLLIDNDKFIVTGNKVRKARNRKKKSQGSADGLTSTCQ